LPGLTEPETVKERGGTCGVQAVFKRPDASEACGYSYVWLDADSREQYERKGFTLIGYTPVLPAEESEDLKIQ